jgi:hypothetical protein
MKRLPAVLAALVLAACASPAAAWFPHGTGTGGGGSSPDVLPGGSAPTVTVSSASVVGAYNNITPVSYGSSGDYGYSQRGFAVWDDIPLVEVGQSGVNGTRHIGLVAAHSPTATEMAAGVVSNICSVDVRIDQGAWYTITGPTVNPDASGVTDWNFTVNSQNFADGVHQVDAVAKPCTGPSIIMQGPLFAGIYDPIVRAGGVAISGNVLTVSGTLLNLYGAAEGNNAITVGRSVSATGVAPNTFIDGDSTTGNTDCGGGAGSCTGTGKLGTYHVTVSQTLSATPGVLGNERSFYFVTDYHNSLGRGTHVTFACNGTCNGVTGSDSNSGLTASLPKATVGGAMNAIRTQATGSQHAFGGTVCLMNSGSNYTYAGSSSIPAATLGFTKIVSAKSAPCNVATDPGNPTIVNDNSSRTWFGINVWWQDLTFSGAATNIDPPFAQKLVVQNVTATGSVYNGGLLGSGGYACLDSTVRLSYGGGCSGTLIARNNNLKFYSEDGFHGAQLLLNNTVDGGGPRFVWTSGTSTIGSPVITGVTVAPGYTLAQAFPPTTAGNCASSTGCIGVYSASDSGSGCFSNGNTTIIAVDDVAHTITTDTNATSACTGPLTWPGVHGDEIQNQTGVPWMDTYIANNDFGASYPGDQQGLYLEATAESGIYVAGNAFRTSPTTVQSPVLVNGGNDHVMYSGNTWSGGGAFRQDNLSASNDETFIGDQCLSSTFAGANYGAGTGNRRKAAASNACYTNK